MPTISFERDWTLTPEQAEKLAKILEQPPTRIITDEEVKNFENRLKEGEELLRRFVFRFNIKS